MPSSLFDRIVVVDWSASSRPKLGRDSIWIAESGKAATEPTTHNLATRREAVAHLVTALAGSDQVLLAVDFSLGYPRGTSAAFGLPGSPWEAIWRHVATSIVDDVANRNNRFEVAAELNQRAGDGPGPFWGCPPAVASSWLTTRKVPSAPLPTWRLTEDELRRSGRRPFTSWQLLGAGAVGGQSLVGIAALSAIWQQLTVLGRRVDVWPFTTGLSSPPADANGVVVAEVWPSMVDHSAAERAGSIRDEAQVETLARTLRAADRGGTLGGWFEPDLTPDDERVVVAEEGWTLGAGTVVVDE